jgi:DNA-binding PadR family transcriptional regulator
MNRPRKRLLTFNDPQPLRIDRRLAMEIGFLESVVLLQLEFLISISNNEREGQFWTYHTLKQLKEKHFPWLSQATICRTLQVLEDKGLIVRGHYNRSGFDRTQWFALNYAGIAELRSVVIGEDAPILQTAKSTLQDETPILHDETSVLQDEATIPKIPSETTQNNNNTAAANTATATQEAESEAVVVALLRSLTDMGVTKRKAERLVRDHPTDKITEQIAMLGYRKADDPAAVLVRAIEEDWAPPAEYRKAELERQQEAKRRQRREEEAKTEAAKAAIEQAEQAAQDSWWEALNAEEQDELRAQAEAALRTKSPFLFSNGGPKKTGVMFKTMLDAERRRIIAERMGDALCADMCETLSVPSNSTESGKGSIA